MRHHEDDEKSISERLADLEKALEHTEHTLSVGTTTQVEDLTTIANPYLTRSACYDLDNKALHQIIKYDDGRTYRCLYLAVRCKTGNEEKGVKAIAKVINDLSSRGLIHSCLAPISSVKLALTSFQPQSAVFCFVHVPESQLDLCKVLYKGIQVEEGGVSDEIEDLRPVLEDGEFLAEVRVSSIVSLLGSRFDTYVAVQDQIDLYLAVLPKGTQVKSVVKLAVNDFSIPYCVKFFNPLMKQIKKVSFDYVRCGEIIDEKFVQFNLYQGIRYFDADEKELYK
jgi:hypothetical protein